MATTAPGPDLSSINFSSIGGASGANSLGSLSTVGLVLGIAGAVQSSIGAYYAAVSQRYSLRSQALDLEFQGSIAEINARAAELDASFAAQAGRNAKARATLQYGQAKAGSRATQAASGLQAGVGSNAEIQASIEIAKAADSLTIERNISRNVGRARNQAVDFRNRALLSRVSAQNINETAGTISPFTAAFSSLLGSAGRVSSTYLSGVGR